MEIRKKKIHLNNPEYVKINDKKYKINTSFKIAIECNKIAQDDTINDTERALAIIYKLFGDEGLDNPEDYEKLLELGNRYLLMDKPKEDDKEEPDMDFEEDYNLIWTSIYSEYNGLDIDKEKIHWWKFMDMVNGLSNSELGNCCVLNRVRNLRNFDAKTIKDSKEREKIIKAQQKVALKKKNKLTKEQEQSVEEILKLAGIGRE